MKKFTLFYNGNKKVIFCKHGAIWSAKEYRNDAWFAAGYLTIKDCSTPQAVAEAFGYLEVPIRGIYNGEERVVELKGAEGVYYVRDSNFPRNWSAWKGGRLLSTFTLYADNPTVEELDKAYEASQAIQHFYWYAVKSQSIVPNNFASDGIEYQRLHGEGHGWVARGNGYRIAMDLEGKDDTKDSIVCAFQNHPGFPRLTYRKPDHDSVGKNLNALVGVCHNAAFTAGWWTDLETKQPTVGRPHVVGEKLMLVVSELAEAMEGHRKSLKDDKLPHRDMIEVELADAVIRICDLAGALKLDLGSAVVEKLAYNANRPDHKIENRLADGGKKY